MANISTLQLHTQTSEILYLFVNVTTRRSSSETACILLPGTDVPDFIVRESIHLQKGFID